MEAVSNMKIVPTSTSASVCQGGTAPLLLKWHLLFPILVPVSLEICTVGIPLFTVALFLSTIPLMFIITIHLFYFASVSNSDNNYWTIEKSNLKQVASCQCLKCPLRIFSQIRIREFPVLRGEGKNFSRLQIITLEKFSQDSFLIWTKYNFSTNNLVKFSQQYLLRINDHYGKRSILRMCKSKIGGSLNRSDNKNNISCQKGFLWPFPPGYVVYFDLS